MWLTTFLSLNSVCVKAYTYLSIYRVFSGFYFVRYSINNECAQISRGKETTILIGTILFFNFVKV